jgi:hypothetical protein
MQGLVMFDSLAAAIRAGFQVYDRTPTGADRDERSGQREPEQGAGDARRLRWRPGRLIHRN